MKRHIIRRTVATCLLLGLPLALRAADAQANWASHCASCHGRDGAAHTKAARLSGAQDLTDPKYQKSFTDDQAFNDTKAGLAKDGKTKMKPFKDKLSDDEIKSLIAYVRTLAK